MKNVIKVAAKPGDTVWFLERLTQVKGGVAIRLAEVLIKPPFSVVAMLNSDVITYAVYATGIDQRGGKHKVNIMNVFSDKESAEKYYKNLQEVRALSNRYPKEYKTFKSMMLDPLLKPSIHEIIIPEIPTMLQPGAKASFSNEDKVEQMYRLEMMSYIFGKDTSDQLKFVYRKEMQKDVIMTVAASSICSNTALDNRGHFLANKEYLEERTDNTVIGIMAFF